MRKTDALQPVLKQIDATLAAGHRVWLVGSIPLNGKPPPILPPAPLAAWGWFDVPYSLVWAGTAGYDLATHAEQAIAIQDASFGPVNPSEDLPVVVCSGWRLLKKG
jgi:hypothetical protein